MRKTQYTCRAPKGCQGASLFLQFDTFEEVDVCELLHLVNVNRLDYLLIVK